MILNNWHNWRSHLRLFPWNRTENRISFNFVYWLFIFGEPKFLNKKEGSPYSIRSWRALCIPYNCLQYQLLKRYRFTSRFMGAEKYIVIDVLHRHQGTIWYMFRDKGTPFLSALIEPCSKHAVISMAQLYFTCICAVRMRNTIPRNHPKDLRANYLCASLMRT